ncbi:hypothetical protein EBT16_01285 [bacterium]|nr:hypothetical protein [bacterium]
MKRKATEATPFDPEKSDSIDLVDDQIDDIHRHEETAAPDHKPEKRGIDKAQNAGTRKKLPVVTHLCTSVF